jgi:hypothetical protein
MLRRLTFEAQLLRQVAAVVAAAASVEAVVADATVDVVVSFLKDLIRRH